RVGHGGDEGEGFGAAAVGADEGALQRARMLLDEADVSGQVPAGNAYGADQRGAGQQFGLARLATDQREQQRSSADQRGEQQQRTVAGHAEAGEDGGQVLRGGQFEGDGVDVLRTPYAEQAAHGHVGRNAEKDEDHQ